MSTADQDLAFLIPTDPDIARVQSRGLSRDLMVFRDLGASSEGDGSMNQVVTVEIEDVREREIYRGVERTIFYLARVPTAGEMDVIRWEKSRSVSISELIRERAIG